MMFSKIVANQTTWHKVKQHNRCITGKRVCVVINCTNGKLTKCGTFSTLGFGVEAGSIYIRRSLKTWVWNSEGYCRIWGSGLEELAF